MLKKIGVTTVLSAAILFGGVFTTSAESVNDHSSNLSYNKVQTYYSVNGKWKEVSKDDLTRFFSTCFPNSQIKWNFNKQDKNEAQEQVEKPAKPEKEEVQEKPVEQPNNEQAQEPVEKPEAQTPVQESPQPQEQPNQQEAASELSQFEQQVVELTNNERAKHGLSPLKADWELSRVAREKSKDMAQNNYFDHNSPVYGSPFDMMKSYGISYRSAGENIAKGQRTPQEVVNAWMNSEGHRANILNGDFTHIGVGYVEQGNHWTQQFIGK